MDKLSIVIPFYNGHPYVERLLDTLPPHLPVIIVDDLSDPPLDTGALLARYPGRSLTLTRRTEKGYFAGAVNNGIRISDPNHDILVLNQDVWFDEGPEGRWWMGQLAQYRGRYAMIGERIAGVHPAFPYGYIHGTFMFLRRDAIDAVGLLDEEWYPLWGNSAEWQWRAARKGFQILPLETIPGFHHARQAGEPYGAGIKTLLAQESSLKFKFIRTPPLVSVIVLSYNYGRYLRDCIHSLIGGPTDLGPMPGQSLQSFEVLIIDDASTDETQEVATALADPWQGIHFYRLPKNVGTAAALNAGIELAVGKYVTFLSADDMREPESLAALVKAADAHPHRFIYDDIRFFGEGRRLKTWQMGWEDERKQPVDFDFDALLDLNRIHAGILYPKQAWHEVGGYPEVMRDGREDWAFNIALGRAGWCGVRVPQANYLYRNEGQGRHDKQSDYQKAVFREKIQRLFPDVYRGERPMGCCGSGRRASRPAQNSGGANLMAAETMPGTEGMVQLVYQGSQMSSTWRGPNTHITYRFGKDRPVGWVDRRDVGERGKSGFLNMKGRDGQWLFKRQEDATIKPHMSPRSQPAAQEPAVPPTTSETTAADTTEPPAAPDTGNGLYADANTAAPHPSDLTVDEVLALELTPDQWRTLLEQELAGKKRKGVVVHAETKLAES